MGRMDRDGGDPPDDVAITGPLVQEHDTVAGFGDNGQRAERLSVERRTLGLQRLEGEHDVFGRYRLPRMPARSLVEPECDDGVVIGNRHSVGEKPVVAGRLVVAGDNETIIGQTDVGGGQTRIVQRIDGVEGADPGKTHRSALRRIRIHVVEGREARRIPQRPKRREAVTQIGS